MRSGLRSSNATGHAVGHANAQVCGVGGGVRDAKGDKKSDAEHPSPAVNSALRHSSPRKPLILSTSLPGGMHFRI